MSFGSLCVFFVAIEPMLKTLKPWLFFRKSCVEVNKRGLKDIIYIIDCLIKTFKEEKIKSKKETFIYLFEVFKNVILPGLP